MAAPASLAKGHQQPQILVSKAFRLGRVDDLDHPNNLVALLQRRTEDRARGVAGLLVNTAKEPWVLGGVITYYRLAGLRHPSGNALPQGDAEFVPPSPGRP